MGPAVDLLDQFCPAHTLQVAQDVSDHQQALDHTKGHNRARRWAISSQHARFAKEPSCRLRYTVWWASRLNLKTCKKLIVRKNQ